MKKMLQLLTLLLTINVTAQNKVTLAIGDAAPPIKYSKWLKGTPVTSYSNNRVYVLEFWATWCGPCIAAMPHLSELSNKYKDKTTFIGVNVKEKTGDQPYETCLPNVTRFVNSSGNRMSYDVIADNNAQDMFNLWMKPAGIAGIPTTFVVQKGKIAWIGHPIDLDKVIDPILNGTYDLTSAKKEYEKKSAGQMKQTDSIMAAFTSVQAAVDAKDFQKAFQLIDENIKTVPITRIVLKAEKFKILLNHFSEEEVLKYADELKKEGDYYDAALASTICDKDGLSAKAYRYAAGTFRKTLETNTYSLLYDKLAQCYAKSGDMKSAVEAEQQAIDAAKKEVNDPKYAGRVFDYTITDFEATLKKYKSSL